MALASLLDVIKNGIRGTDGEPVASGTVDFYTPGTLTHAVVYADDEGAVLTQPITLDANGAATVYTNGIRRMIVNDANGAPVPGCDLAQVGGETAAEVLTDSDSFSVTDAESILDLWKANNGGMDWKIRESASLEEYAQRDWNKHAWIDVVADGGATGDGATLDDAAILKAYNRLVALGGGTLYFPPGKTYQLATAITIASSLGIRFLGGGISSVIRQTTDAHVISATDVNDLCFESLNLTCTATAPTTGAGIKLAGCKRVRILGVTTTSTCNWGVDLDESSTNTFADTRIYACNLSGYRSAIRIGNTVNLSYNVGPQIISSVLDADAAGGQIVVAIGGGVVQNTAITGCYISGPVGADGIDVLLNASGGGLTVSHNVIASAFAAAYDINSNYRAVFFSNQYPLGAPVITDDSTDSVYLESLGGGQSFTGTGGAPNLFTGRGFRYIIPDGSSGTVSDPSNFAHLKRRGVEVDVQLVIGASKGTTSWGTTWVDPVIPATASTTSLVKFRWDDAASKFRPVSLLTTTT